MMPSFGTNLNVMCYLDDIYIYLKAVGSGAIPRGRPAEACGQARQLHRGRECLHGLSARALALACAVLLGGGGLAAAQLTDLVSRTAFRVCADPSDLPFSNEAGEGFENEIAALFAEHFGRELQYTWYPMSTGFVRRTLLEYRCDVIPGYAQGDEMVLNTNHYYTLDARAGDPRRQRPGRRDDARRPAPRGPQDRGDRRQPARQPSRPPRPDGDRQGLQADGRHRATSARTRRCSPISPPAASTRR